MGEVIYILSRPEFEGRRVEGRHFFDCLRRNTEGFKRSESLIPAARLIHLRDYMKGGHVFDQANNYRQMVVMGLGIEDAFNFRKINVSSIHAKLGRESYIVA